MLNVPLIVGKCSKVFNTTCALNCRWFDIVFSEIALNSISWHAMANALLLHCLTTCTIITTTTIVKLTLHALMLILSILGHDFYCIQLLKFLISCLIYEILSTMHIDFEMFNEI